MPANRNPPFARFNFLVDVGDRGAEGPDAGFQEVSNLDMEIGVSEARSGGEPPGGVREVSGLNQAGDITLKRGAMGSGPLFDWLAAVRNGDAGQRRTVRIMMRSEDHTTVVAAWVVTGARVVRFVAPVLSAKAGGEVAIDELTLAHEGLEPDPG